MQYLIVGLGGFMGAVLRFAVSSWAARTWPGPFPFGTLLVNLLGCLALGAVMAVVHHRAAAGSLAHLFASTGILGALTTFSTLGYETLHLLSTGRIGLAGASVAGNLGLGLAALAAGQRVVSSFLS